MRFCGGPIYLEEFPIWLTPPFPLAPLFGMGEVSMPGAASGGFDIFPEPYELHRPFNLEELYDAGIADPRSLSFHVLAGEEWVPVLESWVDLERQEVIATLNSGGTFAVFGNTEEPSEKGLRLSAPVFRRGDADGDGAIEVPDATMTLGALFQGQAWFACEDATDLNDDGAIDLSDPVALLQLRLLGRGEVPAPGAVSCGRDPTLDFLACEAPAACD